MPDKSNFLADVAALARAGYSVSDVKEILQMSKTQPDAAAGEPEEPEEQQDKKEPEKPNPEKEEEPGAPGKADNIEDLKKQIATMQEQNDKLQEQLKQAQKDNINKDQGNKETRTNDELLGAIFKDFM